MTKYQPGDRFGHWTYLEHRGKRGLFKCDCGLKFEREKSNIFSGASTQCRNCGFKAVGITKTRNYDLDWKKSRMWYATMSSGKHSVNSTLSKDDVWKLTQSNCYYCDAPPSNTFKTNAVEIKYNGIDRVDSKKNYDLDNVRPCCWKCNSAKKDMSEQDFRDWLDKIHAFWKA